MMFINTNISAHFNGIAHVPTEGFALSGICLRASLLSISAGHLLISPEVKAGNAGRSGVILEIMITWPGYRAKLKD